MRSLSFVFLYLSFNFARAADSLLTLSEAQLLAIVQQHHPVVKQAAFMAQRADATRLQARGGFDPQVGMATGSKTFDGSTYYQYSQAVVSIPTWFGIEVMGGLQNLGGNNTDPTETTGPTSFAGISIPLAKNLLMDKRRAALFSSRIFSQQGQAEQRLMVNNLLMEAVENYWLWVKAWQQLQVVAANVRVNEQRFDLVKRSYFNGERPAIDTAEALTQLQSFRIMQSQQQFAFRNAGILLSAFLWLPDGKPYLLPEAVLPDTAWDNEKIIQNYTTQLDQLLAAARQQHPALLSVGFKVDLLQVDKRLKFQELLPKLDLQYNRLGKGYNLAGTAFQGSFFQENFLYGVKFQMPLRLATGRADYRMARLKLSEAQLEQGRKLRDVELKVRSYHAELLTLQQQVALQSNNYSLYLQLVRAEETRLFNGESSLFLVNSRENKALEAREKLIELKTKFYKTAFALRWAAGQL